MASIGFSTASEAYIEINRRLHEQKQFYGKSGGKWVGAIRFLGWKDILDYGCGKGSLQKGLDFPIAEYDPAIPGKDAPPGQHKWIVCTDVLEHIEPEYLDAVLDHIQSLMRKGGFFVIATRPARKTLPDGRNAHLIVQPWAWWQEKLESRFVIAHVQHDVSEEGEVLVVVWRKDAVEARELEENDQQQHQDGDGCG